MPKVFVSIGSCVNRKDNVRAALQALRKRFGPIRYSSVYETEAVGFKGDPFFNLVISFDSNVGTDKLTQFFRSVERKQGRCREVGMPGPCPLDIDLLLYGEALLDTPELKLPRDDVLTHAYVLEPLAELVPEKCYPGTAACYQELWADYRRQHPSTSLRLIWDPFEQTAHSQNWCYPDYTLAC